jgi:hypothetical protein
MTITDSGRRSREDLLAAARQEIGDGPLPSKTRLAKSLGVHFNTASPIHEEISLERAREDARRREERRQRVSKLGRRKRFGSGLPVRSRPFTTPSEPAVPVVVEPVDIALEEPAPEVVGEVVPAPTETPSEPARPVPIGSVVILAAMAPLAVAGIVAVPRLGLSWSDPWLLAGTAGAALLVLIALVWSGASVMRAMVAGRTARDVALDVASWAVAGVAGFLAAYGQVRFAQWAGVTGNMRFLVPGILEPSVVVLLLLANRRVKRRRSGFPAKPIGKLLALAAVLGGFAVYTNVVHSGGKAGLVFGAATVVGLILWWVKLQDDAAPDDWDDAPQSKRLSRRTSRYRLLRWVILFPQTRRAWLISLDHSIADAEVGLELARLWRRSYDEARVEMGRRMARRLASAQVDEHMVRAGEEVS